MAFDFPNAPTVGQVYTSPTGVAYTWDGQKWTSGSGYGAIYIADTPPSAPSGSLWWESDSGILYISYNDGNSIQWVAIGGGIADAVRYGAAQTLTGAQQTQARTNIGAQAIITSFSAVLGADVTMNTNAWFDGPSVAQGAGGTLLVVGVAIVTDTVAIATLGARISDGGSVNTPGFTNTSVGTNTPLTIPVVGILTNPVGNLRLQGNDQNGSPSGRLKASSTIAVIRIA
jgi:hypothetical protein